MYEYKLEYIKLLLFPGKGDVRIIRNLVYPVLYIFCNMSKLWKHDYSLNFDFFNTSISAGCDHNGWRHLDASTQVPHDICAL